MSEIMHFSRQMAAFVRGGIPLMDGIDVIAEGTKNKRFRKVLLDINEQLREGVPFADALADHAAILPPYYLGIVRTAELTGRLDIALEQLSGYIERDLEAKSKLKAALMYPSVVLLMSIVTVNILMIFVLPKFVDFFDDLGAELPLSTRMLMSRRRLLRGSSGSSSCSSAWRSSSLCPLDRRRRRRGNQVRDRCCSGCRS